MDPITDASAASSTAVAEPEAPTIQSRVGALKGPAYDHWRLTGDVDAAEALNPKPDVTRESSTAAETEPDDTDTDETETASAPGEARKGTEKQPRNWKQMRIRQHQLEGKIEELSRQLAATRQSAPGTKEDPPAATAETGAPEPPDFPDINDFDDPKAYTAKVKEWRKADAAYTRSLIEQSVGTVELTKQRKASNEDWQAQRAAVKAESKDPQFDAVLDSLNVSLAVGKLIFERKDGAKLAYHLGKNKELAAKLIERTDIAGEYQNVQALMAAARKDPDLAIEVGRKLALAEVELDALAESLKKKTVPAKETLIRTPKPTSEVAVEPKGSAVEDEEAEAIASGDTGRYIAIANRKAAEKYRNG